jgi:hypothetical protein
MKRDRARKWMREDAAWNVDAAASLYRQVAEASLAHWLDSTCKACNGTPSTNVSSAGRVKVQARHRSR